MKIINNDTILNSGYRTPRPGVLDLVAIVSFVLSVLNVVWVAVIGLIAVLVGLGSWLGGPIVGAVGSALAALVMLFVLFQSGLSLLLFVAAWKTWGGSPGGRSLHKGWAWITLITDLIVLAFVGGMEPGAWARLIYAAFLLWVMSRDDVRDYFEPRAPVAYGKPGLDADWS
jgi:hypothetical protein